MTEPNSSFYLNQPEPQKSCLLAMRDIVLQIHPAINETKKYGMPCFCYHSKIICYLWIEKNSLQPYFLLADGNLLTHPALETGSRSRMKILRVDPSTDLPITVINTVLQEALQIHTN